MKIAVVQQNHAPGEGESNLKKALASVKKALDAGADVILLHEEMLYGYHEKGVFRTEPKDGPSMQAFRNALRGTEALAVYGYTEQDGERKHISVNAVTAEGLLATYRKNHLWKMGIGLRDETVSYTPGDGLRMIEFMGAKIGFLICYDGDFPEMFRAYAKAGCDLVLWSNNRESRGPEDRCRQAAIDNSIFVATSCCTGIDEQGIFCPGMSNVVAPGGKVLAEITGCEGMIFAEIDPAEAREHRKTNPWYQGARFDLY